MKYEQQKLAAIKQSFFLFLSQLETLKAAIRYLKAENAHLKSLDISRSLQLDELQKPIVEPEQEKEKEFLKSMARETRVLMKDMRTASATPKVVSLDASHRGGKWQSRRKAPDYQYQTQQSVLYTLKQRSEQLRNRLYELDKQPSSTSEIAHVPVTVSTIWKSTVEFIHSKAFLQMLQQVSRSLAKVRIPAPSSSPPITNSCRRIHLKSAAEFERIHSVFLR